MRWRAKWVKIEPLAGMVTIARFTVRRSRIAARRAPLAVVAGLALLIMGSIFAAPLLSGVAALEGPRAKRRNAYAVRIVLPQTDRLRPAAASQAAPTSPLDEMAQAPQILRNAAPAPTAVPAPMGVPAPPVARAASHAKVAGVLALNYSLAGGANAVDAIELDKPVSIAGTDAGRIPIRIDGNAKVYAQGKLLAALIAAQSGEKAVPAGLGEGYVSLEALRALGIGVRYDAIRDRLVVDPPAA